MCVGGGGGGGDVKGWAGVNSMGDAKRSAEIRVG